MTFIHILVYSRSPWSGWKFCLRFIAFILNICMICNPKVPVGTIPKRLTKFDTEVWVGWYLLCVHLDAPPGDGFWRVLIKSAWSDHIHFKIMYGSSMWQKWWHIHFELRLSYLHAVDSLSVAKFTLLARWTG